MTLRGKVCRKIIQACALNDEWNLKRFQYINRYLAEMGL